MFGRTSDKVTPIHNSLQIWYSGQPKAELQLDINVWRLKNTLKRKIYLDFGIKIMTPNIVEKVYIYFPFIFNKSNIVDLGEKLKNTSILNGIFNENYSIYAQNKSIDVKGEAGKTIFSIYELDIERDIILEQNFSGTVMSFDVKNKSCPKYFRLRIMSNNYGTMFEKYKPKNSFFDSAFIETEIIDFRINEKRNQDSGLMETIDENNEFIFKEINFFVTSPIQDEIVSEGTNLVYKRQLEMGNFWKDYLSCEYKRMSVYKNKLILREEEIDNYNCFCKINYRKSNLGTITLYLVVLFLLSFTNNYISDYLKLFLCK